MPKVAVVAPPTPCTALDGVRYETDAVDLVARIISMGNCHRAFALTGAMCLAVAARIDGTVVQWFTRHAPPPRSSSSSSRTARPVADAGHVMLVVC